MLLLTDQETQRFVEWLEMNIRNSKGMIDLFKQQDQTPVMQEIIKKENAKMLAAKVIRMHLVEQESMTVG